MQSVFFNGIEQKQMWEEQFSKIYYSRKLLRENLIWKSRPNHHKHSLPNHKFILKNFSKIYSGNQHTQVFRKYILENFYSGKLLCENISLERSKLTKDLELKLFMNCWGEGISVRVLNKILNLRLQYPKWKLGPTITSILNQTIIIFWLNCSFGPPIFTIL